MPLLYQILFVLSIRNSPHSPIHVRYPSTQALITRAENALFQRAYGDTELTEHMSERADPEAKNAVQALMNTAARVAEIQDRILAGELHDIDFAGDLAEAAKQYVELKRTGQNVQDWLDQESLFDQDETVRSLVGMMEKYKRSGVKLTGAINDILSQVEAAGNPGQTSLIETAVPTKGEIVERAQAEDGTRYSERTYSWEELTAKKRHEYCRNYKPRKDEQR